MTSETQDDLADEFIPWLSGLSSVALAELNGAAALQTRVDRKYLIARSELAAMTSDLSAAVRVLEIAGQRQFGYWSTYYDTNDLRSFLDAARRRPRRFKVRVRTYLDSEASFLEVKTRSRRGETAKSRIPTGVAAHGELPREGQLFIADTLTQRLGRKPVTVADQLTLETMISQLRPTMMTEYQRTTLLVADRSRATIDHALCVEMHDGPSRRLVDHVVVETKSSSRPSVVDRMLWDRGHRPVKFSKYGTGLVLLNPELPGSKWNRVLRHELDWAPARQLATGPIGTSAGDSQRTLGWLPARSPSEPTR